MVIKVGGEAVGSFSQSSSSSLMSLSSQEQANAAQGVENRLTTRD